MTDLIAEIAVSGTAYSFDMLFSYAVPENMAVKCGCRVLVPFGRGNTRRIGVVMGISEGSGNPLKPINDLIDREPVISDELLELALYLREHTFCTYFDAVKIMLPPAMSVKVKENFTLVKKFRNNSVLSADASALLEKLKSADDKELNDKA